MPWRGPFDPDRAAQLIDRLRADKQRLRAELDDALDRAQDAEDRAQAAEQQVTRLVAHLNLKDTP